MHSFWQRFTLADLAIDRWVAASYSHRWVGSLQAWRQQSWLMRWGDEIGAILAAVVFVIAPFVSTDVIGVVMGGVAAFWLLLTLADDREGGITPIHVTLLLFWAVSALSAGLSPARDAAIRGLSLLSLYLLFFVMVSRLCRSPKIRNLLIAIYLNVSLVVSVYGVNQSIYGAKQLATWVDAESALAKTTRVYSYVGNPNELAGYLLPAIAFSVAAVVMWRGWVLKTLAVVMVVVNLWCLQATYSRGAWVGAIVMLVVGVSIMYYWFRPLLPKFWRSWALPIALGSILVISAVAVVLIPNLRDRASSIVIGSKDSSNNFRINVWAAVDRMIQARPILGWGPGDRVFKKIYPIYQVSPRYSALGAYSVFLETIVEVGFIGFACLMWAIVVTGDCAIRGLIRLRKTGDPQVYWLMAAFASVVGLLVQGATDVVWYRPVIQTLWWLCVAIVASFYYNAAVDEPLKAIADSKPFEEN
jgi:putative inorganic carbon (hco3(-)) transporter